LVSGALKHSIRKWTGLLTENLEKHKLVSVHDEYEIRSKGGIFEINADSCALCRLSQKEANNELVYQIYCTKCPLAQVVDYCMTTDMNQPFNSWSSTGNPKPMIKALEKALKLHERKKKKK
jgi:hypothetical protein